MLSKLGKYEIKRELGRGAMGIVYEGFDPFIERTVAIKTILKSVIDQSEAGEILSRFRREAQASGRLTHPNIVSVYEYGEENDMAFIAMEFILGKELKEYFGKEERFQIKDCLSIMSQLLDALDYAHGCGVVHRDIKPANIIITKNNQIKVVDFGIARIESSELTQVGTLLGTPAYMSPEQFRGITTDCRSDIYSSGVILYQFLTGDRPFTGNPTTLMHKVLCQAPVPPSELNPSVSKALEDVVKKAMSKQPEDRFQTAAEFSQALNLAANSRTASSAKMADTDATLAVARTQPDLLIGDNVQSHEVSFDLSALSTSIEKQLNEAQLGTNSETAKSTMPDQTLLVKSPATSSSQLSRDIASGSILLAGLAREADGKQVAKQAVAQPVAQDYNTKAQRLHEMLGEISNFFNSLAQHIKNVEPTINRSYNFGRRTTYANLTCRSAFADSRRRDLSDSALLDYVVFSIRLCAPAPVLVMRPRDMLEALKEKLDKLKLRVLDDLELLGKGPQQEWVQVRLAPDFPVQLQFKGNYDENCIDVQTLNIETFGFVAFKLKLEDVTPRLMDDIGLFLLGRTDKLPEALRRI